MRSFVMSILLSISFASFSQELIVDWDECFGAENLGSISYAIDTLPESKIITSILVGLENDAFTNYHDTLDSWVLILNENGSIFKERCFGGSGVDNFFEIKATESNIYFIGNTNSTDGDVQSEPIGGLYDLWVVKTDLDLNIIWEKQYGGFGKEVPQKAIITDNGGLLILADIFEGGGGDISHYYGSTDIWLLEIDADGNILWDKTLGNDGFNPAEDFIIKDNGNIVVLGTVDKVGGMIQCNLYGGLCDIWLSELDASTKEILWQKCYGGSKSELAMSILKEDYGYFLVGVTESSDGDINSNFYGEYDAWVFQIDLYGEMLWEQCFGGSDQDSFWNIYKLESGGYLFFGGTRSEDGYVNNNHCPYPICYANTWVVEIDNEKNIIWNNVYGPVGYDSMFKKNSIVRIGEKDFIIANEIHETDNHSGDVDCEPYPINNFKSTWIYRLYDPNTVIKEGAITFLKIYPNPAKNNITFELPQITKESFLHIKDIYGKSIAQIPLVKAQSKTQWDCSTISSGVYFYQTEIDGEVYRGKIVVN